VVEPGLEASVEWAVTTDMTAQALGSGDVPVLATPAVLALAEQAACRALDGRLGPGTTSVGAGVELSHLAPTPVGARVRATARLVRVNGRELTFELEVSDPAGPVAEGTHRRVIVDRGRFLAAARRRAH
jgi:predicted thioesterase